MSGRQEQYPYHINVKVPEHTMKAIEQYISDTGLSKSDAIRDLILHGVNFVYFIRDQN